MSKTIKPLNQFFTQAALKPAWLKSVRDEIYIVQNQSFTPTLKGETDFSQIVFKLYRHPFRGRGSGNSKSSWHPFAMLVIKLNDRDGK
ncbi:MAG: hypothetical protein AAF519_10750 [Bacteroidota bacterium]